MQCPDSVPCSASAASPAPPSSAQSAADRALFSSLRRRFCSFPLSANLSGFACVCLLSGNAIPLRRRRARLALLQQALGHGLVDIWRVVCVILTKSCLCNGYCPAAQRICVDRYGRGVVMGFGLFRASSGKILIGVTCDKAAMLWPIRHRALGLYLELGLNWILSYVLYRRLLDSFGQYSIVP